MIVLLGLNHRTAELGVRERCHFAKEEIDGELRRLNAYSSIDEALIVSTCNRVELFTEVKEAEEGLAQMRHFLSTSRNVEQDILDKSLYSRRHDDAVHHLFRVASSLDSMIVGEPQILGQMKESFRLALEAGTAGGVLRTCFEGAFRVAKRVRTETEIVRHAVSLGSVVLDLARKIFESMNQQVVLLIGAGEMMQKTAQSLLREGAKEVLVTNRTHDKAISFAEKIHGTPFFFDKIDHYLPQADIIVTCTAHQDHLITQDMVQQALQRRSQPMFFVDLSVPRNIDTRVGDLEHVYLYDFDDFSTIMADNLKKRQNELQAAENIIVEEWEKFASKAQMQICEPIIRSLRQKIEGICEQEIQKTLKKLPALTLQQENLLAVLKESIAQKILHDPVQILKEEARNHGPDSDFYRLVQELFKI